MITNIVVHPKGATHYQLMSGNTYFLKCVESVWLFASKYSKRWLEDDILNNPKHPRFGFVNTKLTPIR